MDEMNMNAWVRKSFIAMAILVVALPGCRPADDPGTDAQVVGTSHVRDTVVLQRVTAIDDNFGMVVDAALDSRGYVYVADFYSKQVHAYDARGQPIGVAGRPGGGPGEFQSINSVVVNHDSVWVLDAALRRVTVYAPFDVGGGVPERTVPVFPAEGRPSRLHVTETDELLIEYTGLAMGGETPGPPSVVVRRLAPDGALAADSLLVLPAPEWLVMDGGAGWMPFGARPTIRLGPGDTLWTNWSADPQIHRVAIDGGEARPVRFDVPARLVTRRDLETLARSMGAESDVRAATTRWDDARRRGLLPEEFPRIHQLVVADDGSLWVQTARPGDEPARGPVGGFRYLPAGDKMAMLVVGPGGRAPRIVLLPRWARLVQVRGGRALTLVADDMGVERIDVYAVGAAP